MQQFMPTISKLQIDGSIDSMFNPEFKESCPVGFLDLDMQINTSVTDSIAEIHSFVDQLNQDLITANFSSMQTFNKPKYDKDTLWQVYEVFESDRFYSGAYPSTLKPETLQKLRLFVSYYAALKLDQNSSNKLYTHSLSNNMLMQVQSKLIVLRGDPSQLDFSPKYIGYSGEQKNIFSLMLALGLTSKECLKNTILTPNRINEGQSCQLYPTYASNFIVQLGYESQIYHITTFYNGLNFDICTGSYGNGNDLISC